MRSAKELCALLITRQLKELSEDESDVVVDYLEDIGIEVDIDTDDKTLCRTLLEKAMEKDIGKQVPISAYSNQIISDINKSKALEKEKKEQRELERKRNKVKQMLESKSDLPGCTVGGGIIPNRIYNFVVDPDLGIQQDAEGNMMYTAVAAVPVQMYEQIFANVNNPILELVTAKGNKGYVRVVLSPDQNIYITPLVHRLLKMDNINTGYIKLCVNMPTITQITFTFYGNQEQLNSKLEYLIFKLPNVINAFSSLSLGMELVTDDGSMVRVDGLEENGKPIFSGIIPVGMTEIPFVINPDK